MIWFKCVAPGCSSPARQRRRWQIALGDFPRANLLLHLFSCLLFADSGVDEDVHVSKRKNKREWLVSPEWLAMWELSWVKRMGNRAKMFACQSLWHATAPKKFNEHVGQWIAYIGALRQLLRIPRYRSPLARYLIVGALATLIAQTARNVINYWFRLPLREIFAISAETQSCRWRLSSPERDDF